jgi:NADH-quinone oxidoreductase subunit L
MVAAGIYLVARTYFIFEHGPFSLEVVAWIGGTTAFLAATMALVANDIKRVLAFSTVSQLGYMMLALGVGGRTAAMFHLATHACFKALLFLGAGSVIHAVHSNDIRDMGGLSKKMLGTFWTFSFAWIAISGIWPFAGFFSKDAILEAAHHSGHLALFWLGVFVAFLTAFYMTRLYVLVFVEDPRDIEKFSHAHESPMTMVIPMAVLAVLSLAAGLLFQYPWPISAIISNSLLPEVTAAAVETAEHAAPHWFVPAVSTAAAFSGIIFGFLVYSKKLVSADAWAQTFKPVYNLLDKRYWFDEVYLKGFIRSADGIAKSLAKFDLGIFDRFGVDGIGYTTFVLAKIQGWFDRFIVDGLVDLWGLLAQLFGAVLRRMQTGLVQNYILIFILGFGLLIIWKLNLGLDQISNFIFHVSN